MDIKETISEGVEVIKEHIPQTDPADIPAITQNTDSNSFWSGGFPGWIFPTLFTLHVFFVALFASFGNHIADDFLTKHWLAETGWMATIFVPWLGFKGWKHHSNNKVVIATKTGA